MPKHTTNFPRPMGVVPPVTDAPDDADPRAHFLDRYRAADRPGFTDLSCQGIEDEHGNPICEGEDVRPLWFLNATDAANVIDGEPAWRMGAWCLGCREQAEADGYRIVLFNPPEPRYIGTWHVSSGQGGVS